MNSPSEYKSLWSEKINPRIQSTLMPDESDIQQLVELIVDDSKAKDGIRILLESGSIIDRTKPGIASQMRQKIRFLGLNLWDDTEQ